MKNQLERDLEFAAPTEDIKALISSYYLFRADGSVPREPERAERAQLRFLLSGSSAYEFCDGTRMEAGPVAIIGPTTGPTVGISDGPIKIFGAGLQPAAWGTLIGKGAERYTNRLLDPAEILGDEILDLHQALCGAADLKEMVEIADTFTRVSLEHPPRSAIDFTRTTDDWLTASLEPDIEDLAEQVGLSVRQTERTVKRYYGAPPKLLARKYRAMRAAVALIRKETSVEDLIGEGFYDQSHLIRELKQFTGLTPREIGLDEPSLVRRVARGRKTLTGKSSNSRTDS